MLIRSDEVEPRQVDEALAIRQLIADKEFTFDIAAATLAGPHPLVVNAVSDRAYYFLDGAATVTVGSERYSVRKNDLVAIPRGTPHGLEGQVEYLVITSPPYDPDNEEVVSNNA